MGWHSAVSVMQEVAEKLTVLGRLPPLHQVRRTSPLPAWMTETLDLARAAGKPWYHVYLDNFCGMEKGIGPGVGVAGKELHDKLENAWTQAGVLSAAKKRLSGAPAVNELGAYLEGEAGTIGPGPDRLLRLIQSTLVVIGKGVLRKKWIQVIARRWVHCMAFRRPSMVWLDNTWSYISGQASGSLCHGPFGPF